MPAAAKVHAAGEAQPRAAVCGEVTQVYAVVVILTLVMACFEASNRALVTDFIASFFAVAALNMFEVWGAGGAAAGAVLAVACVSAFVWASRKIEAMEAYAKRFDAKSAEILKGSEIGPPSLKAPALKQRTSDIMANMRAAEKIFSEFEERVMHPLASGEGAHYKCNLKRLERVREKVKLEYDGHGSLVKDLCRGLVVCDTVAALEGACAALDDLAKQGVFSICQIKNRLRDPPEGSGPTASGYRDLNVDILFHEHVCEVQFIHSDLLTLKTEQTPVYNLVRSLGLVGPLPGGAAARRAAAVKSKDQAAAGNKLLSRAVINARHAGTGASVAARKRVYGDPRTLYGKGGGVFGLAKLSHILMEAWMADATLNGNAMVARWHEGAQKAGFKFLVTQVRDAACQQLPVHTTVPPVHTLPC